mgnify:CR=1 FL=1
MTIKIDPALCAKCKGSRRLCGRSRCPILVRLSASYRITSKIPRREIYGSTPPSILVGEWGYPSIRLGANIPLIVGAKAREYDFPEGWWGRKSLEDIIALRASMVYSGFRANAKINARTFRNKLLMELQNIALSQLPVDTEAMFKKPPVLSLKFDGVVAPVGPRADVLDIKIVGSPSVPRRVDYIVSDTDVDARTASTELYEHGISFYHIVRLFSLGLLGEHRFRRIVPTRWAITAVDKVLGNRLLSRVRGYKEYEKYAVFYTEYVGNKYLLLFVPGDWSFEMLEIWLPRSVWVRKDEALIISNYEYFDGKARLSDVDGGYYAIRFPVLEYLSRIKRKAVIVAFREITPDYYAPIGSWQIRESVRNALKNNPIVFDSLGQALKYISSKLLEDFKRIFLKSTLLKTLVVQEKITKYLKKDPRQSR